MTADKPQDINDRVIVDQRLATQTLANNVAEDSVRVKKD